MRSNRPYVQLDPAVIEQARQMDLLSYLQRYDANVNHFFTLLGKMFFTP